MVNTIKFSEFLESEPSEPMENVGLTNGANSKTPRQFTWTSGTRPATPYNGLLGFNTTIQLYEFYNSVSSTWVSLETGGSGSVTQINTGTGLTGGPITTAGTISFAAINAESLWANLTGASAVPTEVPLTTFLLSANNLDDLTNAATARINIGLEIGVDVEAWNNNLDEISAGTWAGATSITTLGTIVFGTWQSVAIGPTYGGTGLTSYALGDILYASATNVLGKLSGNTTLTKRFLSQTGNGTISAAPVWDTISGGDITGAALTKVDDTNVTLTLGGSPSTALLTATSLTLGWTGQLSLARGGTNANLTASNGGIVYSTASALGILAGTATAGQMLQSGSSTTPAWSTATWPATTTINQLLYSSANNTVVGLATANSAGLLTNSSGVPAWVTATGTGAPVLGTSPSLTTPAFTGVPTGTITAGTYTPTVTPVANVSAATGMNSQYIRVGNQVMVAGTMNVDAVTTATVTQVRISLPIASNLGATGDASGVLASNVVGAVGRIEGEPTSDTAQCQWIPVSTANDTYGFTFTYQVI